MHAMPDAAQAPGPIPPAMGRLAYMTEPGSLEIREYELPELEQGTALLEVLQTNVCGSEVHIFQGKHPLFRCGGMGHEMVGRLIGLGAGLHTDSAGTPVKIGDRIVPVYAAVCGRCENCNRGVYNACLASYHHFAKTHLRPHFHGGTFATHYHVHADQPFYRVPENVSDAAASSANCALSQVLHGLDRAQLALGQTVVIQGAGGLGLSACAVARERGARVIVIDKLPARLETAKAFGAHHVINFDEVPELTDRVKRVQQLAGAEGADVVVEVTGVPAAFAEGVHYLRPEGVYVVMGNISQGQTTPFDPALVVRKSARIVGVNRYPPKYLHQAVAFLAGPGQAYPFDSLVDRSFKLDETKLAIDMSARREVQRATIFPNR
ncbi:zinc-binding dehydrogenase [Hydrogenophaga sp. OTU3427]|uniref:zinc-binding dehydrogenase n=1 Tax=Hydrogenophaga sp. OTU3427 TaxID=3043856 RepID=UPI00313DF315